MDILPGQVLPGFYDSMNRRFAIDNPPRINNSHCPYCFCII